MATRKRVQQKAATGKSAPNARQGDADASRSARARTTNAGRKASSAHGSRRGGSRVSLAPDALEALKTAPAIEVSNVALPLDAGLKTPKAEKLACRALARSLGLDEADIRSFSLVKRSVDARKKSNVHFNATFSVELAKDAASKINPLRGVNVRAWQPAPGLQIPDMSSPAAVASSRIIVAGTGPAGLFCALYLAQAGLRPLVVERGADVDRRMAAIDAFATGGPLDTVTNVQFGEGGAGTFSDGKLTTGTKSPHIRHVLEAFVEAGAPEEILWQAKPHIGTDKLPQIVKNIRERIVAAGGEVLFLTRLARVHMEAGSLRSVSLLDIGSGEVRTIDASRVVLACGHSARDVFELVRDAGFALERKPFSMGVRIEHPASLVDHAQYGAAAEHPALGAADYKMAVHVPDKSAPDGARGVYTFCMCPGGEVVAAASEEGGVVVNGMSRFARDGENSNSALLADVKPSDLPGNDVLAGVALQREVERAAFALARRNGGGAYSAPAQTVGDFMAHEGGRSADSEAARRDASPCGSKASALVRPTYPRGVAWCDLHECLPPFVTRAFKRALPLLDAKLHGFAHPEAVLTGPETRSSSPVRMLRGKNFQAKLSSAGASDSAAELEEEPQTHVYPCGEGAGYAGGIMSAAVDGLRVAEAIAAEVQRDRS